MRRGTVSDKSTFDGSVVNKDVHTKQGSRGITKCGTIAGPYSAHLLGNRIQCVQNMFRQFACRLVSELGMRRDGVPDQFET